MPPLDLPPSTPSPTETPHAALSALSGTSLAEKRDARRREARGGLGRAAKVVLSLGAAAAGFAWLASGVGHGIGGWTTSRPTPAPPVHVLDAKEAMAAGEAQLAQGAYAEAALRFEEALKADPARQAAYQRRLDVAYLDPKAPVPPLATLLPGVPARVAFLLSKAEQSTSRHPAVALAACEQALALAPGDPRALVLKGRALMARQDLAGALAAYQQAFAARPSDLAIGAAIIDLHHRLGDTSAARAQAIALYRPLAATHPEPAVQAGLLEAYLDEGLDGPAATARHRADAPQLGAAARKLALGAAYVKHYQRNPNWNREAYPALTATLTPLLTSESGATAAQRGEAATLLATARLERATHLAERSESEAARAELTAALALRPQLGGAHALLAEVYEARARLSPGDTAIAAMEAALALAPDPTLRGELARAHANLGVSLSGAGKAKAALRPLGRAIALDPGNPVYFYRAVEAQVAAGEPHALLAAMRAAGLHDRGAAFALAIQGGMACGRRHGAERLLNWAMHTGQGPADVAWARAELLAGKGQRNAARKLLWTALAGRTQRDALWGRLAAVDRGLADHAKGAARIAALTRAAEDLGHQVVSGGDRQTSRGALLAVLRDLSDAHMHATQVADAARVADRGLLLAPENPALGLRLAVARAALGATDPAVAACRTALTGLASLDDPAHAPLCEELGRLLVSQKRWEPAIAAFKEGLSPDAEASPGLTASLYYGLAFAHAGHGERGEALNAIRQYAVWSLHDGAREAREPKLAALERSLRAGART